MHLHITALCCAVLLPQAAWLQSHLHCLAKVIPTPLPVQHTLQRRKQQQQGKRISTACYNTALSLLFVVTTAVYCKTHLALKTDMIYDFLQQPG